MFFCFGVMGVIFHPKGKNVKPNTYAAPHKCTLQLLQRCHVSDKGGHVAYRL